MKGSAQQYTWTPQVSGTSQWFNDIQFTDLEHGWAVGTRGTIVTTTDGGETWTTRISGTNEDLHSVFFLNQDTGWAAGGTSQPVIIHSTDGGIQWAPVAAELPGALPMKDIAFTDAQHGYAISAKQIFRSSDGGTTWQAGSYSSLIASILNLEELFVISENSAFACGYYRNKSNETLPGILENISLPGGQWLPQGLGEFDPADTLSALCFTESMSGFTGSTAGKIYTLQKEAGSFASSWKLNYDSDQGRVHSIVFPFDAHGMFNVTGEEGSQAGQYIYHTADTGSSWSSTPEWIPDLRTGFLAAPDVNHAWIAGSNGIIYKGERIDPVSVTLLETGRMTIIPNPFTSSVRFESPRDLRASRFELFDLTGKVIRAGWVAESTSRFTLNGLEDLPHGIYFLKVRSADRKLNITQKIVKH